MPPNLGGLLQITNNVNANYQTTRFINVTDGPAQLTSLLHNDISLYHNNTSLTLFAPLDHVFDQNSFSMQVLDRFLETGWLLHLQNVIRHHFTDQTISSGAGPHTIQMLSGFNTSIRVQPDSNITVDDVPVEPVDTGPLHALNGYVSSTGAGRIGLVLFVVLFKLFPCCSHMVSSIAGYIISTDCWSLHGPTFPFWSLSIRTPT
jgi:hypothetical protein